MKSTILRSITYSIVSYIPLVSDYYSIFIVIFKSRKLEMDNFMFSLRKAV